MIGIDYLLQEIMDGKIKKDILPDNGDFEFSGKLQAMYFSRLRRNMASDTSYKIMHDFQDTRELKLLALIK